MFNSVHEDWDFVFKVVAILAIIGGVSLIVGGCYAFYWIFEHVRLIIL